MAQTETRVRRLTYVQTVNEALRQEMERDPMVFTMGEDIAGAAGLSVLCCELWKNLPGASTG